MMLLLFNELQTIKSFSREPFLLITGVYINVLLSVEQVFVLPII